MVPVAPCRAVRGLSRRTRPRPPGAGRRPPAGPAAPTGCGAQAPLAEDEERRAPGVALQAGQAHEEGGRRRQAQRRRLMAGTGVVAQGPGAAEQQQAEQGGQRRRATGGADAYPVGTLATKRRNCVASSPLVPAGQGRLRARRDHRLSSWPASSRRLSHCVSSALTMRLACRSRSSSSARKGPRSAGRSAGDCRRCSRRRALSCSSSSREFPRRWSVSACTRLRVCGLASRRSISPARAQVRSSAMAKTRAPATRAPTLSAASSWRRFQCR